MVQSRESSKVTYLILFEKNSIFSVFPFESVNSTIPSQELNLSALKSKNSTCQKLGHSENPIAGLSSSNKHPARALDMKINPRSAALDFVFVIGRDKLV